MIYSHCIILKKVDHQKLNAVPGKIILYNLNFTLNSLKLTANIMHFDLSNWQ